jgi:hypothetical protein
MKAVHQTRMSPTQTGHAATEQREPASLGPTALDSVGHRLRAAYAGTIKEPLPVRLASLVERLGERDRNRGD